MSRHFILFCVAICLCGSPSVSLQKPFSCAFAVGDFNGDGRSDLVVANLLPPRVGLLLNDGAGALIEQAPMPLDAEPLSLAVGDVNGDGTTDVVVGVSGKLIVHFSATCQASTLCELMAHRGSEVRLLRRGAVVRGSAGLPHNLTHLRPRLDPALGGTGRQFHSTGPRFAARSTGAPSIEPSRYYYAAIVVPDR